MREILKMSVFVWAALIVLLPSFSVKAESEREPAAAIDEGERPKKEKDKKTADSKQKKDGEVRYTIRRANAPPSPRPHVRSPA